MMVHSAAMDVNGGVSLHSRVQKVSYRFVVVHVYLVNHYRLFDR